MNTLDKAAIGFLFLMVFSIFYSLFLLSVSSIAFSAIALYKYFSDKPKTAWKGFAPFGALILIFILTFISGINSEDLTHWLRHLRLKVPFLFIPIAFYLQRELVSKEFYKISLSFFLLAIASSFQIVYQVFDVDSILLLIKKGQTFSTPVDHIKYSIYIAFAIIIGLVHFVEKRNELPNWLKPILSIGSIYLFVILHLLAVRSGLAVFYISMFFILLRYAVQYKQRVLYAALAILMLAPFIAYKTIPTFNKKIEYMIYDLRMFQKGEGGNLSDSGRMYSYKVGWDIVKSYPILGTGIGDLKAVCKEKYKSLFGKDLEKYPHNQYLFILAGSGIVGLLLFLIGMCYPIFYFRKKQDSEFFAIWLIFIVSFLVENTLERSYSISFFLLFLLGGMCKMDQNHSNEEIVSNPQSR